MSPLRAGFLLGLLVLAAALGCGQAQAGDTAVAPGSSCAKDADCPSDVPKCTQAGACVAENRCDTDADCRGELPFCDTLGNCEPCREDSDCPSDAPVCAQSWEGGVWCAQCRVNDSSTCTPGTWCSSQFSSSAGQGGTCKPADCASAPNDSACLACMNENASPCVMNDGPCVMAKAALEGCYQAQDPGWAETDCPLEVPSFRGCTPAACEDEANAFDACIASCPAVTAVCSLIPPG